MNKKISCKRKRKILSDYDFPNLSNLQYKSILFSVNRFFRGAGPKECHAYALTMNFIRLVDLAVQEYELGRDCLQEALNNNEHIGSAIASAGHFEVCLNALKRSINFLKAIRGSQDIPIGLKSLLPRQSIVLKRNVENQVNRMRNAIEHLERDIKNGEIQNGQALCVYAKKEMLELGCHCIRYEDLAKWLTELNTLSSKLALYSES